MIRHVLLSSGKGCLRWEEAVGYLLGDDVAECVMLIALKTQTTVLASKCLLMFSLRGCIVDALRSVPLFAILETDTSHLSFGQSTKHTG